MTTEEFLNLCLSTPAIPYDKSRKAHHMEEDENGVTRVVNDDPMVAELRSALTPCDGEDGISQTDLAKYKRGLIFSFVIENNEEAKEGVDILTTLHGYMGADMKKYRCLEHEGWKKAIGLLKGLISVDNHLSINDSIYPEKNIDRAKAALKLQHWGASVSVNEFDLKFDNIEAVYAEIDQRIKNIGGQQFIELLLKTLPYENEFGRFILPKRGNEMDIPKTHDPAIPYNYLLNLGIKNISEIGSPEYANHEYFNEILDIAKTICFAIFSVESYSFWEKIYLGDKSPIEYIRDIILHESVFNLHQSSTRFIVPFISFICKNVNDRIDDKLLKFRLPEYEWIVRTLIYRSSKDGFSIVPIKSLKNKRVRDTSIKYIIDHLSMPVSDFNIGFSSPADYDHVNFWNYPIAMIDEEHILLFPQTIAARGWYEGLLNMLRQNDKNIDGKVGYIMEDYLCSICNKHNIKCVSGEYTLNNKDKGECDGLIESSSKIALIEMKKRSLIRDSRSGIDYQIINNLVDVVKSQAQSFKTSYGLMYESPLKIFLKDKSVIDVSLNGRKIERITITPFPYGEIQDRMIFERLLELFFHYDFNVNFSAEPTKTTKELKKEQWITTKFKEFKEATEELIEYCSLINERRALFHSWFFDLEQIQYLIKNSSDVENFMSQLQSIKCVTTGTFDFYNEILFRKFLSSKEHG